MRESCSCGSAIHTLSYKRVVEWRNTHNCETERTILPPSIESFPVGFTLEPEDNESADPVPD